MNRKTRRKSIANIREALLKHDVSEPTMDRASKFRKRNYKRAVVRTNYLVKLKLYPKLYPAVFSGTTRITKRVAVLIIDYMRYQIEIVHGIK